MLDSPFCVMKKSLPVIAKSSQIWAALLFRMVRFPGSKVMLPITNPLYKKEGR